MHKTIQNKNNGVEVGVGRVAGRGVGGGWLGGGWGGRVVCVVVVGDYELAFRGFMVVILGAVRRKCCSVCLTVCLSVCLSLPLSLSFMGEDWM